LEGISGLQVNVASSSEDLQLETDESYTLSIYASGAIITAKTVFGAMYGLETFSQVVSFNFTSRNYEVKSAPWEIVDSPQFPYRGILIDTSRHYLPIWTIKKVIDSLSYAKLNTLHWHIVDTQSFPLESKRFPKLWEGSWSPRERYTQEAVKEIVSYAKDRGVKVMPEFDGPGHAWAWGVGYPQLRPAGYDTSPGCDSTCPTNPCDVPLDPTNDFTYELISGLFEELTGGVREGGIFSNDLIHLGGDEVEYECWNNSAAIKAYMKKYNLDFEGLYKMYVKKASDLVISFGRTPVNWEEVFNHFGTQLNPKTVIHVWPDHTTLARVVAAGYRGILSDQDNWYLDHLDTPWTTYYLNDPYQNIIDQKQQKLVIGGEACMWGESVDPSDIFSRIWPKAAAISERLWNYYSANEKNAVDLALPRLSNFRCNLLERGIATAPLFAPAPNQPGSCGTQ